MIEKPLVSILIPVYNAEKTISKCISCAINQTYENIEIIVIDDCSKDNTINIISTFNNPKIKFYRNEHNLGLSENWNECLRKSNGKFVHYLHCDDLISEDCIEKKVNIIANNDNVNLVFNATKIINENDKVIYKRNYFNKNKLFDGNKLAHKSFTSSNIFGEPSNVLFRKSILTKTGMFSNTKYTLDWEMWIKIACLGSCYYINEYLSQYRISKTNLTSIYNISVIIKDDAKMISNLDNYKYIELTQHEKIIHRICYLLRTFIRKLYIIFIN